MPLIFKLQLPAIVFILCGFFIHPNNLQASGLKKQAYLKNFTVNNGLGSNTVYQSICDKDGLMWFATNRGISTYDGREFRNYTTLNGLVGNTVFGFHEDFKGRIWYYTMEGKIGYYENMQWHSVTANKQLVKTYGGKVIGSLHVNKDGTILIGFKEKNPGVVVLYSDGRIQEQNHEGKQDLILYKPYSGKNIWTVGDGLTSQIEIDEVKINIQDKSLFTDVVYLESNGKQYTAFNNKLFEFSKSGEFIQKTNLDKGTYSVYYDTENDIVYIGLVAGGVVFKKENSVDRLLHNTSVYHINKDREGGFWFCTEKKGVFYWHPSQPYFYKRNLPFSNSEHELLVSHAKSKFIIKDGNCLFDYSIEGNLMQIDSIICDDLLRNYIVVDSFLFIHIYSTLYMMNVDDYSTIRRYENTSLYDLSDNDSTVFVSTFGVVSIDKETHEHHKIIKAQERFFSIAEDGGRLFISKGDGLYIYEDSLRLIKTAIDDLQEKAIALYNFDEGLLINQYGNGLLWWNKNEEQPVLKNHITLGKFVRRVQFLSDSSFIAITDKGVELIEKENAQYKSIILADDFINEKVKDAYITGDSLYFFYDSGIFIEHLEQLTSPIVNKLPGIEISSTTVNDSIIITRLEELPHWQNNLSIRLQLISFAYLKNIDVEYQLNERSWKKINDYHIELNNLSPGKYKVSVRMLYKHKVVKEEQLLEFEVTPAFYKRVWFIILACLTMLSLSFWLGRYLTDQKQDVLQEKLLKQKAQLNALQAQINPHFLFNVFNSIQHLVLKQQTKEALKSMSKFSKLMRMALNHSKYEFITLSEELKFLELYISLENLRLDKKVEFEIMLGEDIDDELITIPPLIIQILIENSMWHGLQPSEKNRLLIIKIIKVEDLLHVLIIDNGIGVKKSKELKSKFGRQRKSMGMSLIKEKIEILEKLYGVEGMGIQYSITNPAASNEGTTVNLKIMYGKNF